MATMNMQQALAKMAANVAAPVKTTPSGQPKVAPAPGNSGNATSASGNPTVAPGPTAHSNATSASGNPKLDMAPEGGQKGKSDTGTLAQTKAASEGESCGDDKMPAKGKAPAKGKSKPDKDMLAQTKAAGFAMGLYKAAAAASAADNEMSLMEEVADMADDLEEAGIDPEVFSALLVLEDHGISLQLSDDTAQKVASIFEKNAALNRGHVLGALTGSPSATIAAGRAPEGEKLKAGAKGYLRDVGHSWVGSAGGAAAGAGLGALAAKALKKNPRLGAMIGGIGGSSAGSIGGLIVAARKTNRETKKKG